MKKKSQKSFLLTGRRHVVITAHVTAVKAAGTRERDRSHIQMAAHGRIVLHSNHGDIKVEHQGVVEWMEVVAVGVEDEATG
jgi:hypothetical protein